MTSKPVLACIVAVLLCSVAVAQKSTEKPQPKSDPPRAIAVPTPLRVVLPKITPAPVPSITPRPGNAVKPGGEDKDKDKDKDKESDKAPEKKAKGPTIITSVQATFDQKANLAVFIENVVVVDPEFNVHCDKLTAYFKHDDDPKPAAGTPPPKAGAKPVATPAAKGDAKSDDAAAKKKGGGLEKAIAEANPGNRVLINQDKTEADGTITHGIGRADKAIYDAVTGDVFLYGSPEVIQGPKSVVAIDPDAVITLNRDGHMHTKGMTKTTIDNKDDSR